MSYHSDRSTYNNKKLHKIREEHFILLTMTAFEGVEATTMSHHANLIALAVNIDIITSNHFQIFNN